MTQDKHLLKSRMAANFRTYNALAVVQDAICGELAALMAEHIPAERIRLGFEFGAGTGFLTRRLMEQYPAAEWIINDLAEESLAFVEKYTGSANAGYLWGDAETAVIPAGIDLMASASTIQWFDDIPSFISKAASNITPKGYLAITTFGPEMFREIKTLTEEGLEYYDADKLEEILKNAGFEILALKEYTKQLLFDTPRDVLRHIKATGVNSLHHAQWTKKRLAAFEEAYIRDFSAVSVDSGIDIRVDAIAGASANPASAAPKVSLTYHPIIILAQL